MRIVLIGAGNLATQLGIELEEKGHQVIQVYSRTAKNAQELASRLNCPFTDDLSWVIHHADLYIIAVTDRAIEAILAGVNFGESLVVHTAGGLGIDVFISHCKNYGVLYPLQTFSKQKRADFKDVPICIEASSKENLAILNQLAGSISEKVHSINSEQRLLIHLAAVFTCNFVNHFYLIAEMLLKEGGIEYDFLKPIIMETAFKAVENLPENAQTGPAVRNDSIVMDKHFDMLKRNPEWLKLYKLISKSIYQTHNNKNGII